MIKKIIAPVLAAILILIIAAPVGATGAVDDIENIVDGIVSFRLEETGADTVQKFIDTALAEKAGVSSEWYVIALSQSGSYDFSSYIKAAEEYISSGAFIGATTRQKISLAYLACGVCSDYTNTAADETIGEGGVMSYIFGLHLLNNGAPSDLYTRESVTEQLLSCQLSDGGWAVMGTASDVDVTAMALSALAPNLNVDGAGDAVLTALDMLSRRQLSDGGYKSMMSDENPESAAQVLLALLSLGIDFRTDERFIKNGNTILDALLHFKTTDGGFAHAAGGTYNYSATEQVFYALVGTLRMFEGKTPLFVLDNASGAKYIDKTTLPAEQTEEGGDVSQNEGSVPKYKPMATVIISVLFVGVCAALIFTKKRNIKNFIAAFIIFAGALTFVWLTDFRSAESYYGSDIKMENPVGTVTITIRCDTIVGKSNDAHVPQNGIILDVERYEIEEGETAYDILVQAARKHKISVDEKSPEYIRGIGYIYEKQYGSLSGWMFYVNGVASGDACNQYVLKDGDRIEWLYSCDIGNDLK